MGIGKRKTWGSGGGKNGDRGTDKMGIGRRKNGGRAMQKGDRATQTWGSGDRKYGDRVTKKMGIGKRENGDRMQAPNRKVIRAEDRSI